MSKIEHFQVSRLRAQASEYRDRLPHYAAYLAALADRLEGIAGVRDAVRSASPGAIARARAAVSRIFRARLGNIPQA